MNIIGLFLNDRPRTGGHKRYLELLSALADRGHRVLLLVSAEGMLAGDRQGQGPASGRVEIAALPTGSGPIDLLSRLSAAHRWARSARRALPSLSRGDDFDLVLVFGESHAPAGTQISRSFGIPLVLALRSDRIAELDGASRRDEDSGTRAVTNLITRLAERAVVRARERMIAQRASRIVFQTDRDGSEFTARNPAAVDRTTVIPNSIDASWFDPKLRDANRSTEVHRLIFVGSLIPRKGVLTLLRAFNLLREEGLEMSLEICGSGPLEPAVRRFVADAELDGRISLHGDVPNALERIAAADLLVLPSLYDSFPNVLLEALHTGTPAIATRAGGSAEVIDRDDLLVPPGDPVALAGAVRGLSEDSNRYAAVRQYMRDRRPRFAFDWVQRFERVLQDVAAPVRARGRPAN